MRQAQFGEDLNFATAASQNDLARRNTLSDEQDRLFGRQMGIEDLRDTRQSRMYDEKMGLAGALSTSDLAKRGMLSSEQDRLFGRQMGLEGLRDNRMNRMYDERMGWAGAKSADTLRRRQQLGQERQIVHNQPFQDLAALLGGAPMPGNPQFNPVPQTDLMGGTMAAYQAAAQAAAQRSAGKGSALSGLGSLAGNLFGGSGGGGAAKGAMSLLSDDRIKENVKYIGKVGKNNIYEYNYAHDPLKMKHKGFLASEIQETTPDAIEHKNGLRYVNYTRAVQGAIP